MQRVIKIILTGIPVLLLLLLVIFWYEADKEVRILCGEISNGISIERVEKILGTGEFLHYKKLAGSQGTIITTSSSYNAGTSDCTVLFSEDDISVSGNYSRYLSLNRVAAWIGLVLFTVLGLYYLLLTFGVPPGKIAQDGYTQKLSGVFRAVSSLVMCMSVFGGLLVAERAGLIALIKDPEVVDTSVWIFSAIFAVGAIAIQWSKNRLEKRVMTPLFILLFIACVTVALGPLGDSWL